MSERCAEWQEQPRRWQRAGAVLLLIVAAALPARALQTPTACTPALLLADSPASRGNFSIALSTHYFLIPSRVVSGLALQPSLAMRWAASDAFTLAFDAQTVDNGGPGRQGRYFASRTLGSPDAGSGNFFQEQTLGASWRVGGRCQRAIGFVLGGTVSRGTRSYLLRDSLTARVAEGDNQGELVPTLDARLELRQEHWRSALGAALAFFPADNALYLRRLPDATGGGDAFGATLGLSLDGAVLVSKVALRARFFAPLTGANTIRRSSGRTVRWPVYNVALAYSVNSVVATEISLTNALGSSGALALVADREYAALGGGVRYMTGASRSQRTRSDTREGTPLRDGSSVSLLDQSFARVARMSFSGGSGGTHSSIGGSPVPDVAMVAFLDYVSGTRDEGDLGGLLAVRFVRQASRSPLSLSVLLAAARSNNVLVNLLAGRADEFARRGLKKSGFRFGDESLTDGKLYLLTAAVPLRRDFANGGHIWGAPTLSAVQRRGIELVGVVGGATWPLVRSVSATLEAGVPLASDGNALEETSRVRRLPWRTSLAWIAPGTPFTFDLYAGNRVGSSPFHALRARANAGMAVGVGITVTQPPR